MHGYDTVQIDGGEPPASSESRPLAIERSEWAKGELQAKTGIGGSPLTCRQGPKIASQAKADCSRLSVANEQKASSELMLVWWV